MSFRTIDNVNYYTENNYVTVGDNATEKADGIVSTSYKGPIVIREKINRKKVLYISQYAFYNCQSITKVTIYAKIIAINIRAFDYCINLEYINIPATVTFIGFGALYFGTSQSNIDLDVTIEFNQGTRDYLLIGDQEFAGRINVYIIYPFNIAPKYTAAYPFVRVNNAVICAPSVFTFYTKQTIKCPISQYKETCKQHCTYNFKRNNNISLVTGLIISLLCQHFQVISKAQSKKYE